MDRAIRVRHPNEDSNEDPNENAIETNPNQSLGDPKTKEFLRLSLDKIFGFPSFIRFGWSTAYSILDKDAIQCNFEAEQEDEEDENTPSVTNFFKRQTPQLKCNKFFAKHSMKRVDGFN